MIFEKYKSIYGMHGTSSENLLQRALEMARFIYSVYLTDLLHTCKINS